MGYKERWLAYFTKLDANNNGFIERSDARIIGKQTAAGLGLAEGSAAYHAVIASFENYLAHLIKDFDANKDDKVSKDELLAAVDKLFVGKTAHTVPAWWKESLESGFKSLDVNHDGAISLEEVTKGVRNLDPDVPAEKIKHAYEWAAQQSGTGKYDSEAFLQITFQWATSPHPTPEADVLLGPLFGKA